MKRFVVLVGVLLALFPATLLAQNVEGPYSNEVCGTPDAQNKLFVAWDPSPDTTATGYLLHTGTAPNVYTSHRDVGLALTAEVVATSTAMHCLALTAYRPTVVQPPASSLNGTTVPPDTQIIDQAGLSWTLANRLVMRNGVQANGGFGDLILWWNGSIYVKNNTFPDANGSWWQWLGTDWTNIAGDPRPATPPPPPANVPPSISLTAPPPGASVTSGTSVSLAAAASDPDGSVTKVDFLVNSSVFATVLAPPFVASFPTAAQGSYSIAARATDNLGATTMTPTVTLTVLAPPPPPSTGTIEVSIAQCRYVVTDVSPDGTTSGWAVQFRRNGTNVGTADKSSPFSRTLTLSAVDATWDGVWTKGNAVSVIRPLPATTAACQ